MGQACDIPRINDVQLSGCYGCLMVIGVAIACGRRASSFRLAPPGDDVYIYI